MEGFIFNLYERRRQIKKYVSENLFIFIKFIWNKVVIINIQREKKIFIVILKQLIIMRINYNNFVTVFYIKIKIGWKNHNKL